LESAELSVAIVIDRQRERAGRALAALLAQDVVGRMEILILDAAASRLPALEGADHKAVRVLQLPQGLTYGQALALAVEETRAPVLAFVEEHVEVQAGWARALLHAHRSDWAAVCGEIAPGDLDRPAALRIELVSRNVWSPPARRGEAEVLRWQNVSYKTRVLRDLGTDLTLLLGAEDLLFRRLRAAGHRLYIEPGARMVHALELRWDLFLRGSYYSSRQSAASMVIHGRLGRAGRLRMLAAVLSGPLRWPWVLYRRTRALPDADFWLPLLHRNWPYVLEYYLLVGYAGLLGQLGGMGDSGRNFLDFELNTPRRAPESGDG
jgi:hypothetical protein